MIWHRESHVGLRGIGARLGPGGGDVCADGAQVASSGDLATGSVVELQPAFGVGVEVGVVQGSRELRIARFPRRADRRVRRRRRDERAEHRDGRDCGESVPLLHVCPLCGIGAEHDREGLSRERGFRPRVRCRWVRVPRAFRKVRAACASAALQRLRPLPTTRGHRPTRSGSLR